MVSYVSMVNGAVASRGVGWGSLAPNGSFLYIQHMHG
jgi:hypothetical protein